MNLAVFGFEISSLQKSWQIISVELHVVLFTGLLQFRFKVHS